VTARRFKLDHNDPHIIGQYVDSEKAGVGIEMMDGVRFVLLDPKPEVIKPEILAHALANLCRWTGHPNRFFSVAQHCIIVSKIVPPELVLQGLLHDASEAFIGDINRPLKLIFEHFAPGVLHDIEENIHKAIAKRFKSGFPHDPAIKAADNVSLATERRDLLADSGREWIGLPEPLEKVIQPMGPRAAKSAWMRRFEELGGS
jgi:hypothetical protein